MNPRRIEPGASTRLGAQFDGRGASFALFSAHAEAVELCLFDPTGTRELCRLAMPDPVDHVWSGTLADAEPGLLYGYRVKGPYEPARGHRFNHHKLLLDPYARQLQGALSWSDALFAYRTGSSRQDLSFDKRDSARFMPKAVLVDPAASGAHRHPRHRWERSLLYEAHVRGLTIGNESVPADLRGSFAGLASPTMVAHLHRLGVTAVELLPVHAHVDDRRLVDMQLVNYWGYNTLGFFAPEPRLLASGRLQELRTAVARLHEAGIEVILDVVYNHTAEGNHLGPTLSFRGIDNASYYRLDPGQPRYYEDTTGCGNTLRLAHPAVTRMVLDSLRLWVTEYGIDGFRFDLAPAMARVREGHFDPWAPILVAASQDPVLAATKLIAEPWDIGPGGYQLGAFPPGWGEWNDRFRDTARKFWRGDPALIGELAARMTGSRDVFGASGRGPTASVNFVTCHDGFTLADLVAYTAKHNQANGEENRDGVNDNNSTNGGVEGPTEDAAVLALRRRQRRNLLATLMLAQGTPMLLAGDEHGNSQRGNNNAYAQDNAIGWTDWPARDDAEAASFAGFVAALAALRTAHPCLRRPAWLTGESGAGGVPDVAWLTPAGTAMTMEDWGHPTARCLALLLACPEGGAPLFLILNALERELRFELPKTVAAPRWRVLVDTSQESGLGADRTLDAPFDMPPRAVVLMAGDEPMKAPR